MTTDTDPRPRILKALQEKGYACEMREGGFFDEDSPFWWVPTPMSDRVALHGKSCWFVIDTVENLLKMIEALPVGMSESQIMLRLSCKESFHCVTDEELREFELEMQVWERLVDFYGFEVGDRVFSLVRDFLFGHGDDEIAGRF